MGRVQDIKPLGWDEPVAHRRREGTRGGARFGLRQIMLVTLYFAVVAWLARSLFDSDGAVRQVLLFVMVGSGFLAFGLWAALRMSRYGFIGWLFFVVGYMTIVGSTINFLAIPSFPILLGAIIFLTYRRRSIDREALLWVMTTAADRRMPLGPGVLAFSDQVSGISRIWAEGIAEILSRGGSLPDALDGVPRAVPPEAPILIRMGHESGDLAAGLREAVAIRSRQSPVLRTFGARVAYLCWVLFMGEGIVSFVLYFIIPKFEAIFQDFGVSLPWATAMVVRISHVLVQYGALGMLVQAAVFLYLIFVFVGWANLSVPLIDRLFRRRHAALIFRSLAVVVAAGRPIGPALRSLAQWYPTRWVRRKLTSASVYESEGIDWIEAIRATDLLTSSDAGVLESARRVGNLSWALRELAETSERRFGYQIQVWSQILFVAAMLAIGALVFLLAVAYFTPLTTLITRLAE